LPGKNRRRKQGAANSRKADPWDKALAPSKKRSLCMINVHFEPVFNTAAATQIIYQQSVKFFTPAYPFNFFISNTIPIR
jgi:hypothetical protein